MSDELWVVAELGPVLCIATALALALRRHPGQAEAEGSPMQEDDDAASGSHLAPDLGAAERQLGMLLRRMRAYRRTPHDYARSRIRHDTEFQQCLDLATALSIRVTEFTGASVSGPEEHERIRRQLLYNVSFQPEPFAGPGVSHLGRADMIPIG